MTPKPARLRFRDVARVGAAGLRARRARVALSALGVALGIATMVAVIGISASGQADLLRRLDALGTNLLRAQPGESIGGERVPLPPDAEARVRRVDQVLSASATGRIEATVRRTDHVPAVETGGITVQATGLDLLRTLDGDVRSGTWLNDGTARYPAMVLGSVAADRLGIDRIGVRVFVGDRWFTVTGILRPLPLAPEIDRSAFVGFPAARTYLGFDGRPTTLYERSTEESVEAVRGLLPRTIDPESPENVAVSRPSDALAARAAAAGTFTGLLLGLGAVALLVGGVGIANTMIVSVLERRREIGLRRALGATRGQIRVQFLAESFLLSALGGVVGLAMGALVTMVYAVLRGHPPVLPFWTLAGTGAATLVVGVLAGCYPAVRASRLPPTTALASP
ncbi:ABC transporter permease [Actinomadura spongiicola]|uniref:ABC transporter permease n=1 Tax=Actinomadura spongiicola TaxID=2303421 RepID=A0A372GDN2_9ACTN|nr:ABC transporter permease [Actinomadura spongiicola]RFS83476.1 ABC transporter permease [Actinomadura spongiicola]